MRLRLPELCDYINMARVQPELFGFRDTHFAVPRRKLCGRL